MNDTCYWDGCDQSPAGSKNISIYEDFEPYCEEHYVEALEDYFHQEFEDWSGGKPEQGKFLTIFGRYVRELYKQKDEPAPEGLSIQHLHTQNENRMENLTKETDPPAVLFTMERHPYANTPSKPTRIVNQRWRFPLPDKELELVEEEDLGIADD